MSDESSSTDEGMPPVASERVLDAGALRALAHPVRVQIYDILSQYGPQTASSLAERLGESSGSTSYHLRALAKHDLIREVEGRGTGRERWWERPRGGVVLGNPTVLRTPAGRAASQIVVTETLNRRHQQLMEFMATHMDPSVDTEWQDAPAIMTLTTRLTPAQLKDLAREVSDVIDRYLQKYRDQTGDGVRPVTIRADMFPLPE